MDILRQVLSIVLVFALLGAVLWSLRRGPVRLNLWSTSATKRRSLEAIERLTLSPQHSLHLIRIDDRVVVLATHPQGCALLTEARGEQQKDPVCERQHGVSA